MKIDPRYLKSRKYWIFLSGFIAFQIILSIFLSSASLFLLAEAATVISVPPFAGESITQTLRWFMKKAI